jgi:DNA-binding NtrC family response regulator
MIKIHYLDKDFSFYMDLSTWLPDYCSLTSISIDKMSNHSKFSQKSDIIIINPEYTGSTIELLQPLLQKFHGIPIIFVSDSISLPFVVSMIKNGAYSFFHKRKDKSMLIECIKEILYESPCIENSSDLNHHSLSGIIGNSNPINKLKRDILDYSGNNLNILINGETGTGKELTAKALHAQNFKNKNSIVAVNCGAIPENLIESELFGTKKGAYTDAVDKIGIFEKGHGSTIFLDEIAELSKPAQVKLLRVLENGFFTKVGSTTEEHSVFNLISATNKNLKEQVNLGLFREDLFYRITSLVLHIPPLRERKEDIYDLSCYFLNEINPNKKISQRSIVKLLEYKWPGNIRELKQTIIRAEYLSKDKEKIDPSHIIFY